MPQGRRRLADGCGRLSEVQDPIEVAALGRLAPLEVVDAIRKAPDFGAKRADVFKGLPKFGDRERKRAHGRLLSCVPSRPSREGPGAEEVSGRSSIRSAFSNAIRCRMPESSRSAFRSRRSKSASTF